MVEQAEEQGTPSASEVSTPHQVDTPVTPENEVNQVPNSGGVVSISNEVYTPQGSESVTSGGGGKANSAGSTAPTSSAKPGVRRASTGSSESSKGSRAAGVNSGVGSEVSWRGSGASTSVRYLFRETSFGGSDRSSGNGTSKVLDASAHIAIKAAGEGDFEAVRVFVESGGDVNVKSRTGASTMLSRAASKGHLEVVNFLLERGAAVNLSGRGGMTPLHEAAGCGQVEASRVLLGAGAAVAARDYARRCPLHYAGSSAAVTRLLLDFGADPEAKDKNGKRADSMAVDHDARALLRDARCAVRESGAGDNASRVIASLRRELDSREREVATVKNSMKEQEALTATLEHTVKELRVEVSTLTAELSEMKEKAEAAEQDMVMLTAIEADLRQAKAALKVARAAAAEERSRREELEENFDAAVAEAVATAIAAAVAGKINTSRGPDGQGDSACGVLYGKGDGSINGDWAGGHAPPIIPGYVGTGTLGVKQEQPRYEDDGCQSESVSSRSGGHANGDGDGDGDCDGDGDGSARRGYAEHEHEEEKGSSEGNQWMSPSASTAAEEQDGPGNQDQRWEPAASAMVGKRGFERACEQEPESWSFTETALEASEVKLSQRKQPLVLPYGSAGGDRQHGSTRDQKPGITPEALPEKIEEKEPSDEVHLPES